MSALQTTLPEDVHYDAESFLKLFIKPSIRVCIVFRCKLRYFVKDKNLFSLDAFASEIP